MHHVCIKLCLMFYIPLHLNITQLQQNSESSKIYIPIFSTATSEFWLISLRNSLIHSRELIHKFYKEKDHSHNTPWKVSKKLFMMD